MAVRPVMAEEIILGIIVACLSAIAAARPQPGVSWVVALAGLWTLMAPAVINYAGASASRGNDLVVGIIVLILGVINAVHRPTPVRTSA
jgi:hypothetical protein